MGKKIAVIKLSHLGDILHLLPVVRLLKKYLPNSEITWIVDKKFFPILQKELALSKIITLDLAKLKYKNFWNFFKSLRKENYDAVFDFQGLLKSALIGFFLKKTTYYGFSNISKEPVSLFYKNSIELDDKKSADEHVIFSYLKLLGLYLELPFSTLKKELLTVDFAPFIPLHIQEKVTQNLRKNCPFFTQSKNILFLPFSNWESKSLPLNLCEDYISELTLNGKFNIWIHCYGKKECQKAKILSSNHLSCYRLENLPFLEALQAVALMDGIIGVDTGLLHAGSQMKIPTIGLYGPTNFKRNAPFFHLENCFSSQIKCAPCWKKECSAQPLHQCLKSYSPEEVISKLKELL
jgi:heptosyltransferase-1